jgi:hypothetical protein
VIATRTGLAALTTASPAFRSSNSPLCTPTTCLTGSYDVGNYLAFTLTAASGTTLNLSRLEFDLQRSGTGPRSFAWATSVDNYTTFSGHYTQLGTGLSSTSCGAGFQAVSLYFTADSTQTITGNVLNLSAASYQGLSSISFRLYGWNAEGSPGTGGLLNSLGFSGSLNAPEPPALPHEKAPWKGAGKVSNLDQDQPITGLLSCRLAGRRSAQGSGAFQRAVIVRS